MIRIPADSISSALRSITETSAPKTSSQQLSVSVKILDIIANMFTFGLYKLITTLQNQSQAKEQRELTHAVTNAINDAQYHQSVGLYSTVLTWENQDFYIGQTAHDEIMISTQPDYSDAITIPNLNFSTVYHMINAMPYSIDHLLMDDSDHGSPIDSAMIPKAIQSPEILNMINKSPTLITELRYLDAMGWKLNILPQSDYYCAADRETHEIAVSQGNLISPNRFVAVMAHEVGHACYAYIPDFSSAGGYLAGALIDEGEATLNNLKVHEEILSSGGPEIDILSSADKKDDYLAIYKQVKEQSLPVDQAKKMIAAIYGQSEVTSKDMESYKQYHLDNVVIKNYLCYHIILLKSG